MHLKHLTIAGFKSFAKSGELSFDAPITAIVGPNGSGKSNVAESFRFVLGEQSPSRMRGKKGEDLIWGGTDKVARANRAAVTLVLNNEQRTFPIDFDEVTIERTVHRDGQNEYSINGSRVRLKDVQELLAAANVGPSGHHIISQGEADRILLANPRERREVIEDALGLKVYQYKKLEAERKLKKTRENIERVSSLRREVAPHLKFLERQVKKIQRAIELREQLKTTYAEYLRREDVYLAHHADRLRAARQEPTATRERLAEELAEAKRKLEAAGEDEQRSALVAAEQELATARAKHQDLVRTAGQLDGQIAFLTKRIDTAKAKASTKTPTSVPYREIAAVVDDVEQSAERVATEVDVAAVRRAFQDAVRSLRALLVRAATTETADIDAEVAELQQLTDERQRHECELVAAAEAEQRLQARYDEVRTAIESEMHESREAEREMFRIVGEQRECEATLDTIDRELATIERDREEFKRELQEAVALVGRAATEYQTVHIPEADIVNEDRERQRDRRRELEKMKIRLEELGGANDDIEKEYREVKERDEFLEREIVDLEASVEKLEALIADLTKQLDTRFVAGIEKIGVEFNRFFTLMFGGGEAKLVRVKPQVRKKQDDSIDDERDAASGDDETGDDADVQEGVELDVKLPNKRVRGLDMLSGGERALTSIALIFAMSQVNPPPFIILDETDAALDEANSRRYGDMIEALAQKSQLILITHNRETMRRAGVLYGVTMAGDGVSKLLSVKFEDALAVAK